MPAGDQPARKDRLPAGPLFGRRAGRCHTLRHGGGKSAKRSCDRPRGGRDVRSKQGPRARSGGSRANRPDRVVGARRSSRPFGGRFRGIALAASRRQSPCLLNRRKGNPVQEVPMRLLLLSMLGVLTPFSIGVWDACRACTSFCFEQDGEVIFGRNLDWHLDDGMLVVNQRGVVKVSYVERNPARWVSRYGSVTFNQYGRELPMGGMNEAGLIVENMWLNGTSYPEADDRAALGELQWIQYQLDTAATLEQVIASDERVRIARENTSPLHFLVCDSTGACASIEFLDGEMVVHSGRAADGMVLTNNTWNRSRAFRERVDRDSTGAAFQEGGWSLKRFVLAGRALRNRDALDAEDAVAQAFEILEDVSWEGQGGTQWRIVYEPDARRIHFRTLSHPAIKHLDLRNLDYVCGTPVRVLDLAQPEGGDASDAWEDYFREANLELIRTAYRKTEFLGEISDEAIRWMARYPETMPCARGGSLEEAAR
ncbi:MAG: linear amide C-N hydrolase [Candidatus Eisenbacteria bacterium]|nr:linear amide C-N hydrolase [Candidatus Eisenbacteria bacterium]